MAENGSTGAWPEQLAASVGQQVKRFREAPGARLTAQALADRTAELGHPLNRSVIANLESGRRGTISLADVFVLARALGVPPVALIIPLDPRGSVDILPGVQVEPWTALEWIQGDSRMLPSAPWVTNQDDEFAENATWHRAGHGLFLKHLHDLAAGDVVAAARDEWELSESTKDLEASLRQVQLDNAGRRSALARVRLKELRDEMARNGLPLPPEKGISTGEETG